MLRSNERSPDGDYRRPAARQGPQASKHTVVLSRGLDDQLRLWRSGQGVPVTPVRCFPWTAPECHISLRNADSDELAYIVSAHELDIDSRQALLLSLQDTGTLLQVTAVTAIEEDVELRIWQVQTLSGPRVFQTPLDLWPRPVPGGGTMLEDVAGDLYWIPDRALLDVRSRRLLWPLAD